MSPFAAGARSRRRALRASLLALALLAIAVVARAANAKPFYLLEAISDILAASHTYRVWFTTNCGGNQLPDCSCVTTTLMPNLQRAARRPLLLGVERRRHPRPHATTRGPRRPD